MNSWKNFVFAWLFLSPLYLYASVSGNTASMDGVSGVDLIQGQIVDFKFSDAKGTVLAFISAKCPCSISHEGKLAKLYQDFKTQGFQFVGIHSNSDEPFSFAQQHFKQARLPFPVIEDKQSKIAVAFEAVKTPHIFVINSARQILFQGGIDDSHDVARAKQEFLRPALSKILEGQEPEIKDARTLGCIIKRP